MKIRKPFVNNRSVSSRTPSPEYIKVESRSGSYIALLAEAPADPGQTATPMIVVVNSVTMTRVARTPVSGEYRVMTTTVVDGGATRTEYLPLLEFHSSALNLEGTCDYYRTGSIFTSEWMENEQEFMRPVTGYTDVNALSTAYPPTSDLNTRGYPGDMAVLTDGSLAFSNGLLWSLAGSPGGKYEAPLAMGVATASVTDLQQQIEGVQAAVAAIAAVSDKYMQIENVQATGAGTPSVTDTFVMGEQESVTAVGQAVAAATDLQTYREALAAVGIATISLSDFRTLMEAITAIGAFTVSITDALGGGTITTDFESNLNDSNGSAWSVLLSAGGDTLNPLTSGARSTSGPLSGTASFKAYVGSSLWSIDETNYQDMVVCVHQYTIPAGGRTLSFKYKLPSDGPLKVMYSDTELATASDWRGATNISPTLTKDNAVHTATVVVPAGTHYVAFVFGDTAIPVDLSYSCYIDDISLEQ